MNNLNLLHPPFNVWIQGMYIDPYLLDVLLHNDCEFSYLACSILDLSNNIFVRKFFTLCLDTEIWTALQFFQPNFWDQKINVKTKFGNFFCTVWDDTPKFRSFTCRVSYSYDKLLYKRGVLLKKNPLKFKYLFSI